MAFHRTSFKSLVTTSRERFSTTYKFSKKVGFKVGQDVYIIPLGLENGFYETPCHRVLTHKVDGKEVGFKSSYANYIKCHGTDEEGNRTESLCCTLAVKEKERFPEAKDAGRRIIGFTNYRVHLPVLILGNSLMDKTKLSYPVSKVSILNDLRSESGLKFAFLEMATSSFRKDLIGAYGKKLKEEGILDYELEENSEEFIQEVCSRLTRTVIKVRGIQKEGFTAAMKEYSFFPFDNPAIASGSPEGERDAIVGYLDNQEIQNKICEFLDLFNVEVDNMFTDWTEKELQDYYDSAVNSGEVVAAKASVEEPVEEDIEVIEETPVKAAPKPTPAPTVAPVKAAPKPTPAPTVAPVVEEEVPENISDPVSDDELKELLKNPSSASASATEELEEFEFDDEGEDSFFDED